MLLLAIWTKSGGAKIRRWTREVIATGGECSRTNDKFSRSLAPPSPLKCRLLDLGSTGSARRIATRVANRPLLLLDAEEQALSFG